MNDFLDEVSSRTTGMLAALVICYGFLTHPFITGTVLVVSIVVGQIHEIRTDRRDARVAKAARDQWMNEWARDAVARMELHPIRIRNQFIERTP
jgi:hypothetical protein